MKKYAAMLAAGLIAVLGLTALAPSAEAYPTVDMTLSLNLNRVVSGHTFVATTSTDTACTTLALTFNGQTVTEPGSKFVHTFTAPIVTVVTPKIVTAVCTYTAVTGTSGTAISVTSQQMSRSATITIVPVSTGAGNSSGSGLPNTGGPSIGWLIAGIAALLAGAVAMVEGRRRSAGKLTL
jgi:hypothetical protein